MEQSNGTSPPAVKSVGKTFEIIEELRDQDVGTVTELADRLGTAKSTIHRHLATLEQMDYVVQQDGKYQLGLEFLRLSESLRSKNLGRMIAKERTMELAHESGERALFLVEEQFEGVYMYRAGGRGAYYSDIMVGRRRPLHSTASGKSILAQWSDKELDRYIEEKGLEPATSYTITDHDEFFDEIEKIRSRGYSFNDEEHQAGLRAVGVPVFGKNDTDVLGAFSVFGPKKRLKGSWYSEELPTLLKEKADEVRIDLEYD